MVQVPRVEPTGLPTSVRISNQECRLSFHYNFGTACSIAFNGVSLEASCPLTHVASPVQHIAFVWEQSKIEFWHAGGLACTLAFDGNKLAMSCPVRVMAASASLSLTQSNTVRVQGGRIVFKHGSGSCELRLSSSGTEMETTCPIQPITLPALDWVKGEQPGLELDGPMSRVVFAQTGGAACSLMYSGYELLVSCSYTFPAASTLPKLDFFNNLF